MKLKKILLPLIACIVIFTSCTQGGTAMLTPTLPTPTKAPCNVTATDTAPLGTATSTDIITPAVTATAVAPTQSLKPTPEVTATPKPTRVPTLAPTATPTPAPILPYDHKLTYTLTDEGGKNGVDFILDFQEGRDIRVLQLTDLQIQYFDGIRPERKSPIQNAFFRDGITSHQTRVWQYVDEAVNRAKPDLIVLTGDNIYGETDDSGVVWVELINKMDSYKIPWCVVFGNHDNESAKGVLWQVKQLEDSKYCIFRRGTTIGNSNYNLLIRQGGNVKYLFYMLDTNGCRVKPYGEGMNPDNVDIDKINQNAGLTAEQRQWMWDTCTRARKHYGELYVMIFMHIPPIQAAGAINNKYPDMGASLNQQGKFEPYIKGDIGFAREVYGGFHELYFWTYAKSLKCIGIFVGHQHKIATSVVDDGIRITYGLKTGTYDYHSSDMLGSVKITLSKADFNVEYLYSNIKYPHA